MWREIFGGRHSRCGNCTKQIALRQTSGSICGEPTNKNCGSSPMRMWKRVV